jgi:hypothetical protein
MPLSHQELQQIIGEALPGFTIVNLPIADDPGLFQKADANTLPLSEMQQELGDPRKAEAKEPAQDLAPDEITTVSVRSPENPIQPSAGSQLKYVFVSTKTRKIVAVQG